MCSIIWCIILCGIAGGIRNAISDIKPNKPWYLSKATRRIFDAVIASASVPLFLSIIGNDIISSIFANKETNYALLRLAGFCLLAAIYSTRFLETLSAKVMRLQQEVDEAKQEAKEAKVTSNIVESAITESLQPKDIVAKKSTLSDEETKVLSSLTKGPYVLRSFEGIRASSSLEDPIIAAVLYELEKKQLIRSVETKQGKRWRSL